MGYIYFICFLNARLHYFSIQMHKLLLIGSRNSSQDSSRKFFNPMRKAERDRGNRRTLSLLTHAIGRNELLSKILLALTFYLHLWIIFALTFKIFDICLRLCCILYEVGISLSAFLIAIDDQCNKTKNKKITKTNSRFSSGQI